YAHDRSGAGGTAVVGRGRGHVVAAQCGGGSRRDDSPPDLGRLGGVLFGPAADTAGDPPALGERVSPRLGGPVGGLVAPGAVAGGTLDPRTLASGASVGGGKPHAGPDAARGRMRSRGKAVEAVWGKCGHSQHLMNETSPSKGAGVPGLLLGAARGAAPWPAALPLGPTPTR